MIRYWIRDSKLSRSVSERCCDRQKTLGCILCDLDREHMMVNSMKERCLFTSLSFLIRQISAQLLVKLLLQRAFVLDKD